MKAVRQQAESNTDSDSSWTSQRRQRKRH